MSDIVKRLRYSVGIDAINGDSFERGVCGQQMIEAAKVIETLRSRIVELENTIFSLQSPETSGDDFCAIHPSRRM